MSVGRHSCLPCLCIVLRHVCPTVSVPDWSCLSSSGNRQISFGCQNRRNTAKATSDPTPPTTLTNAGPNQLEMQNWMAAKLPPQTRIAGQQPLTPFQPDITATSHAGINQREERQLPAGHLAQGHFRGCRRPSPEVMIGVPRAPKATGEVLANRASPAA